jgi:hypothetical protein
MREIKHVLELGCGQYSTLTFLNHSAFPHLERLHSIENDNSWAETITKAAKHDQRWSLTLVDGEIAGSISGLDLEEFDLTLIDDSKTATQRASTIRAISAKDPQRPWVVIHDFDVEDYRKAASGFKHKHAFKAYNPWTGLVCNHSAHNVKSLDRFLKNNKTLAPDDVKGWLNAFSSEFKL